MSFFPDLADHRVFECLTRFDESGQERIPVGFPGGVVAQQDTFDSVLIGVDDDDDDCRIGAGKVFASGLRIAADPSAHDRSGRCAGARGEPVCTMPVSQTDDLAGQGYLHIVKGFGEMTQGQPDGFGTVDPLSRSGQQIGGVPGARGVQSGIDVAATVVVQGHSDIAGALWVSAEVDLRLALRHRFADGQEEPPAGDEQRSAMFEDSECP